MPSRSRKIVIMRARIKRFFRWTKSANYISRSESNSWIRNHCKDIKGKVLSTGSGYDDDREGDYYRNYFQLAEVYTTSEVSPKYGCDLVLDLRSMPEIEGDYYDCVFCSGVLEHIDDFQAAFAEITRVLKPGGILLLGLPFRQAIHQSPADYWRFTEYGIKYLLRGAYEITDMVAIDQDREKDFPSAYWVEARKTEEPEENR